MPLSTTRRKLLRAQAHSLKPVIIVGAAGVSEAVLAETDRALDHHELIKVRLPAVDRDARAALAQALCMKLGAQEVQTIGRVTVLYREKPEVPGVEPPAKVRAQR